MALWWQQTSGPGDFVGSLAVNGFGSIYAAQNDHLRWTSQPNDSLFMDRRVWGGVLGGLASMFGGRGYLGRAGNDVAHGMFGSVVATEAVRAQVQRRQMGQPPIGMFGAPVQQGQVGMQQQAGAPAPAHVAVAVRELVGQYA